MTILYAVCDGSSDKFRSDEAHSALPEQLGPCSAHFPVDLGDIDRDKILSLMDETSDQHTDARRRGVEGLPEALTAGERGANPRRDPLARG